MLQRLFRRRRLDLLPRPGAERSARRGEDYALDVLARPGAERLEHRVVLGIDRQHGGAGRCGAAHEQAAGANQAFLVGERDRRAALDRRKRRLQSDRTADRRHHPVGRTLRRFDQSIFAGRGFDAEPDKRILEFAIGGGIGNHRKSRADLARDLARARPHCGAR